MSANAYSHEHSPVPPSNPPEGIVVPLQREAPTQETLKPSETRLLEALYNYGRAHEGLDFTTARAETSRDLAYTAHQFLREAADRYIAQHASQPSKGVPESVDVHESIATEVAEDRIAPQFFLAPKDPVKNRITQYYKDFGTNRRTKSARLLEPEEDFIETNKQPIYANYYSWEMVDGKPQHITRPRSYIYPEIGLGMQLEDVLRRAGHQIGADSVEAVLVAHGGRFLDMIGGSGHIAVNPPRQIIRQVDVDRLPEAFQAENYPRNDNKL